MVKQTNIRRGCDIDFLGKVKMSYHIECSNGCEKCFKTELAEASLSIYEIYLREVLLVRKGNRKLYLNH